MIDGLLNDPAWAAAAVINLDHDNMGAKSAQVTTMKLMHDNTNLYIGVWAVESVMNGLKAVETKRDGPVFYANGPRSSCFRLTPWARNTTRTR